MRCWYYRASIAVFAILLIFMSIFIEKKSIDINTVESKTETQTTEQISTTEKATETMAEIQITEETKVTTANKSVKNKKEVIISEYYTESDVINLAKVLYSECRGVQSKTEQACVAWVVCNRTDLKKGSTISSTIKAKNQFCFNENLLVRDDLYALAKDVLSRWAREKNGETDVGRVLPKEYIYFYGDGNRNYFKKSYKGNENVWDYSLSSPYEN